MINKEMGMRICSRENGSEYMCVGERERERKMRRKKKKGEATETEKDERCTKE
jgi:hypothetical protein